MTLWTTDVKSLKLLKIYIFEAAVLFDGGFDVLA